MSNYYTDYHSMKKRQAFERAQALARQASVPEPQPSAVQPTPLKVFDLDFEIDPEILSRVQGPLRDLIEDALRFANGDLRRMDLEGATRQFEMTVEELQVECYCLKPAPITHKKGPINSVFVAKKDCPACQGRGWRWKDGK